MNFVNVTQKEAANRLRIIYPLWIIVGVFGLLYVPSKILVNGDVAATAANVMANQGLLKVGILANLLVQLFQIIAALYLFKLFSKVDKNNASLIAIFGLLGVPIAMISEAFSYIAINFFNSGSAEIGYNLLLMNRFGIQLASIFWGLWLFPLGYCAYKSGYFPKWIGTIVIIAGFGYLLGSFSYIFTGSIPGFFDGITLGETIFLLYLVILGPKLGKK